MVLSPPTKLDGGYVFTHICLCVCLFVGRITWKVMDGFGRNFMEGIPPGSGIGISLDLGLLDNSYERIWTKFYGKVADLPMTI